MKRGAQEAEQQQLRFGKHKGKTFKEIKDTDAGYCEWVLKQRECTGQMRELYEFLGGGAREDAPPQEASPKKPRVEVDADAVDVLRVGKHRGKTFEEVARSDEGYVAWVLKPREGGEEFTGNLLDFKRFLEARGAPAPPAASAAAPDVIPSGKHAGKTYEQVSKEDSDYCTWVYNLDDARSAWMLAFQAWLGNNGYKKTA